MRVRRFSTARASLVLAALITASPAALFALDLNNPRELVEAYVKTVGDTSGKASFTYGEVIVMAMVPGERGRKLFSLEVVGASRFLPIEGGYQRLHREVGLYTDLETGDVLRAWTNPFLDRAVEVIHIQNDPVNFPFTVAQQEGPRRILFEDFGDHIVFHREVLLRYPSALPRAEYPLHSHSDWYEAAELFNSFGSRRDLENPDISSAAEIGSWSRVGPWLPWMEMADRPGHLLYHGRSRKLAGGVDELPERLREYIERNMPKYLEAPDRFEEPNETSWSYFKKVLDERRAKAQ
jgi:hypothetical protein